MNGLHFLRPDWLWLLLLLPVLVYLWWSKRPQSDPWVDVIDPALRPFVLDGQVQARAHRWQVLWPVLFATLLIAALAGPAWKKAPQTLAETRTPLVIAMDLSQGVLNTDLPPSRLARMRAKVAQLLQARAGAQAALIVFAGTAHAVTPFTDDPANIEIFLPDLQPVIMPEPGHSPAAALRLARKMLRDNGYAEGDIVLLTDTADADAIKEAAVAHAQGFDVYALGVDATSSGLQAVARSGGGGYLAMQVAPTDIAQLKLNLARDVRGDALHRKGQSVWEDGGWVLVPVLLLLLLPMFRRGAFAVFLAMGIVAMTPPNAQAADVWQRKDQVAYDNIKRGNDAYRQGKYQEAIDAYAKVDTAEGHYNLANALAKAGRYQEALKAYDRALQMRPDNVDAVENRKVVERAAKRKPPQGNTTRQNQSTPQSPGNQNQQSQNPSGQSQPSQGGNDSAKPGVTGQAEPSTEGTDKPADAQAQARADAAQKARMAEARAAQGAQQAPAEEKRPAETPAQRAARQRSEPILRRIPDDPGTLLQRKFLLEYRAGKGR